MRLPHVVTSDQYAGPQWEGKLQEWAGIGASVVHEGIYVRTQSGFGGNQAFFPLEQIDELLGLFQDIKSQIDGSTPLP